MARAFRYSRWDGTQTGFDLGPDEVLAELTDDLLYHGDLDAALRRMLQAGFRDRHGQPVMGLREMVERLRQRRQDELDRLARDMSRFGDEQRERLTRMLAALNDMLDDRAGARHREGDSAAGRDPEFAAFMREFGDFFPESPRDLDELLNQLTAQMAAFRAALDSMSPEQRARLEQLATELAADVDLQWQLDQLSRHLGGRGQAAGVLALGADFGLEGLDVFGATGLAGRLGQLEQLENLLGAAMSPGALAEVDPDAARDLLGDEGAASLERLAELSRMLEEAGLVEARDGRHELTPRAIRRVGQKALADLFGRLARDRLGRHEVAREGPGHERTYDTKPYEYGDPFNLSIERTIRNALRRDGRGVPVTLGPDDFEVERTETLTRSSTVLMLDLSLSMPIRDNFLAAKKVAMALHSLISTQFPTDYLGVIGFSEVARAVRPERLPEVSWDFVFGTNMQHALLLARRMLAGKPGTRQIVMITDGEPTAHLLPDGTPFFHYPSTRATVEATLAEVARCTQEGIRINTFMLDASSYLKAFVERMSRLNRGRAFFTTPESLGDFVLVDFIEQKRSHRRGSGP